MHTNILLNRTASKIREKLQTIAGMNEFDACHLLSQTLFEAVAEFDLINQKSIIKNFGCLLNNGLLSGELYKDSSLVAYLTSSQWQLLEMP